MFIYLLIFVLLLKFTIINMKGKNIIITGASSGIGAEICKILHKENLVFAVARRAEKIPESQRIIKYACDISQPKNIDAMFDNAVKKLGSIDVFIANAGFAYCELTEKADWNHIDQIFRTNNYSVFYSILKMKELCGDKGFNFAIMASAMSFLAIPGYSLYAATKFALKGFTDAFRYELKKSQVIHVIYPVATYTDFFNVADSEKMPWPRQSSITVAKATVRGISKNKKNIYPSILFRLGMFLNRFIPIFSLYRNIEGNKFRNNKKV